MNAKRGSGALSVWLKLPTIKCVTQSTKLNDCTGFLWLHGMTYASRAVLPFLALTHLICMRQADRPSVSQTLDHILLLAASRGRKRG